MSAKSEPQRLPTISGGDFSANASGNGPPSASSINGQAEFAVIDIEGAAPNEVANILILPSPIEDASDVALRTSFCDSTSGIVGDGQTFILVGMSAVDAENNKIFASALLEHIEIGLFLTYRLSLRPILSSTLETVPAERMFACVKYLTQTHPPIP